MRALLSVSDKEGIIAFAKGLTDTGYSIISTGGTAKEIAGAGVEVTPIEKVTGFPEILDGRVKTLHPVIHGGILAKKDNKSHQAECNELGIPNIDLVAVNLYPFNKTVAEGCDRDTAIENIDIGGVTLIRAAAKNFQDTIIVVDPNDYQAVIKAIQEGTVTDALKKGLAVKAFAHTADYDAAIDAYLSLTLEGKEKLRLRYDNGKKLRYGENWHQSASFFTDPNADGSGIGSASQLHGKEMSYNNYCDSEAAISIISEYDDPHVAAIIKHANPCGLATGKTLKKALSYAWEGDIVSSFGSVIALSSKVDLETAQFLKGRFVEVVIAPGFDEDALRFLRKKSKDIRLLEAKLRPEQKKTLRYQQYHQVKGGMLRQSADDELYKRFDCVTKKKIENNALAKFAWKSVKYVKSNAITISYEYAKGYYMLLGMGAGQPNRIDSLRKLAIPKCRENLSRMHTNPEISQSKNEDHISKELKRCVVASDGFFPFPDSIDAASESKLRMIVQPGGSKKDNEVIKRADEFGMSMIFTGTRHFNH